MPPVPGDKLIRGYDTAPLIDAESGQVNTDSDPYKLLGDLNSTESTNKDYYDGGGGNNLVFGGPPSAGGNGWHSIGPGVVNYTVSPPAHQGLGAGAVVGIVAAVGFVLVAGGAIAVIRYRKRHAKHGGGGVGGGPGFIEKLRAKILGHGSDEEKAGSEVGTVAPAPDHYANRGSHRSRSTYG